MGIEIYSTGRWLSSLKSDKHLDAHLEAYADEPHRPDMEEVESRADYHSSRKRGRGSGLGKIEDDEDFSRHSRPADPREPVGRG